MADERRGGGQPSGEQVAGGFLAGHDKAMDMVAKRMLRDGPKALRIVAKRVPGVPGLVYDIANFSTAPDKLRAGLEIAGGAAGGGLGGLVGGPVGAAIGSTIGAKGAELLYDRYDIDRWMKDRQAQVNRAAYGLEHAFDNGLPPYAPDLH